MMRVFLALWLSVAIVFCGCATREPHINYDNNQVNSYGFNVDKQSPLENPPNNKARIYFVREDISSGSWTGLAFHMDFVKYNKTTLAGYLDAGWAFYADIVPNTEISIATTKHHKTIMYVLYGIFLLGLPTILLFVDDNKPTGFTTSFIPLAGKIYCIDANIFLVDKAKCEQMWAHNTKDAQDVSEMKIKQIEFLQDYLDEQGTLLNPNIIQRSYYKTKESQKPIKEE